MSHPTRGAWIEIAIVDGVTEIDTVVAPHPGCVD